MIVKLQDNEQLCIATLLKSDEARRHILAEIGKAEHYFVVEECQSLFNVIKRISSSGKQVDLETVNGFCSRVDYKTIRDLYDKYTPIKEANITAHLDLMKHNALEYDLQGKYYVDLSATLEDKAKSAEVKAQAIKEASEDIEYRQRARMDSLKDMTILTKEYREVFEERKKGHSFFTTGDDRIDELMSCGYSPKEMTVIAGRPSNGKSLFRLDNSRKLGNLSIPVIVFNLEMKNVSDMDRLLCMNTKIDATRLIKLVDRITNDEWTRIDKELTRLSSDVTIYMDEEPIKSMDDAKSIISSFQERVKAEYVVVYYDLFTKLLDFNSAETALDFEKICNTQQRITRQLGVHSILVLQINRSADKERLTSPRDVEKVYPRFSQIKNSGAFEEVADNIFLVCRPTNYLHKYAFGEYVPAHLRLEVAKQRHGTQSAYSNVINYKNDNTYLGLVRPPDGWDPMKLKIPEKELDGYDQKG